MTPAARRPWTDAERQQLRTWRLGGVRLAECARRLGRSPEGVAAFAQRAGLSTYRRGPCPDPRRLLRRIQAGCTDEQLAWEFECSRARVKRWRWRLNGELDPAAYRALQGERIRQGQALWRALSGYRSPADCRDAARRAAAAARGWPLARTARQADILDTLSRAGPLTAWQLAERLGVPTDRRPALRHTLYRLVGVGALVRHPIPGSRGPHVRWAVACHRQPVDGGGL